jgi:exosome complex exonuclease DIS3/RRP44
MCNLGVSLFKEQSQKCGDVIFRPFDPVTVQLSLDRSNLQHEKIVLKLVDPQVSVISLFLFSLKYKK